MGEVSPINVGVGPVFPQPRHWRAESEAGPGMANAARWESGLPPPGAEEGSTVFPQPRHWRAESEAGPGMANAARWISPVFLPASGVNVGADVLIGPRDAEAASPTSCAFYKGCKNARFAMENR